MYNLALYYPRACESGKMHLIDGEYATAKDGCSLLYPTCGILLSLFLILGKIRSGFEFGVVLDIGPAEIYATRAKDYKSIR
jgi:hypothetical protein